MMETNQSVERLKKISRLTEENFCYNGNKTAKKQKTA